MLTYDDIAEKLKMAKGTLYRRLAEVNKKKKKVIVPDAIKRVGNCDAHFYKASSFNRIKAILEKASRPVGRPRNKVK